MTAEPRCEAHDMVAAWCAICKGTDDPDIVRAATDPRELGGPLADRDGRSTRPYADDPDLCPICGYAPNSLGECC